MAPEVRLSVTAGSSPSTRSDTLTIKNDQHLCGSISEKSRFFRPRDAPPLGGSAGSRWCTRRTALGTSCGRMGGGRAKRAREDNQIIWRRVLTRLEVSKNFTTTPKATPFFAQCVQQSSGNSLINRCSLTSGKCWHVTCSVLAEFLTT